MNLTPTDYNFLIEAIQQKANGLMSKLREDIEEEISQVCQDIVENFDKEYAEHIKTAPKPRGRAPAKKVVRRTRK